LKEARVRSERGERTLVTALTKRLCEDLTAYLHREGLRVRYLHSEIETLERLELLRDLREGAFDVLVGVNLLREGLDLPEVGLVGILDADKEGFLRSETSLVQTAGRAARHVEGRVLLYADVMTRSLTRALTICGDRRKRQEAFNLKHGIIPKSVTRRIEESLVEAEAEQALAVGEGTADRDVTAVLADMERDMLAAADELQFEKAAALRDQIEALRTGKPAPKGRRRGRR
ncbi:MAG: helicase-related protein, partial [Verrucomicrobiota bacterium]